jgi:DinB family protein
MTGKQILEMQLAGSFNLLQERIQSVSEEEWQMRALPEGNPLGFILWHATRTIDWGIHCAIQGVPEVVDRPEWRHLLASEAAYGAGVSAEEAERVAHTVRRDDVRAYLAAVRETSLGWLGNTNAADLDQVPDVLGHQEANRRYLDPPVWAEVSDLAGLPAWQILARPCVSHIRVHSGEIDLALQLVRARARA